MIVIYTERLMIGAVFDLLTSKFITDKEDV